MKKNWIFVVVLILGVMLGYSLAVIMPASKKAGMSDTVKAERKVKYWVAPMDPSYRRDKPGKSPMGMDLVPVYANGGDDDSSIIKISPRVVDNLGVVTATVKKEQLPRVIDTVGYVAADQDNIETVNTYIDGWIRNLRLTAVGDEVHEGQVLFELYSPSLVNAQQEFLLALKNNNTQLIGAGKKKLLTLGLTAEQIRQLKKTRQIKKQLPVFANTSGTLSMLNIRDGMYIKPEKSLMTIEDLKSIWIRVEVYEKQSSWVKKGQIATAEFPGLPGKLWQGEVVYIYPSLDKRTHTLAVRLKFPNPKLTLKPDMYAGVKIFVPNTHAQLVIPEQAVIPMGSGEHVILALGEGRFKSQAVTLGDSSENMVSVLTGLKEGDEVVTSGQFLIDSESNLNAASERLMPKMKNHQHHTMPMKGKAPLKNNAILLAIDKKNHKITISHQALDHLDMPEMVMELPVKSSIDLNGFNVGQQVTFKLKQVKQQRYLVIDMKAATTKH